MTRLKVCCIREKREIDLAVRHGASAVGLVSAMPTGPGVLTDDEIADLLDRVPEGVDAFLLTSETVVGRIVEQARRFRPDVLQLVDRLSPQVHEELRARLPGLRLAQVVHVTGSDVTEEAIRVPPGVDVLLLDSGRPDAEEKELGGTGRTHDWSVSRRIRDRVEIPVWLAGGLRPGNVAEAIRAVRPHGVDVCSGLRPEGHLDEDVLARFVAAVRRA